MKYSFRLVIDSELAREHWDDGCVLEMELERSGKNPPKPEDVVEESLSFVNNLDDSCEEHKMLKKVFDGALKDGSEFRVKFDIEKSSSK